MQFRVVVLASAAFALAQAVEFTNPTFATITAGQPFTLTWAEADGPVTILLKNGPPTNLQTVSTIGSGLSGGTFVWNVPATLAADTYALEIRDGPSNSDANYSTQFQLIGGVTSAASSTATRTTTGTASASTGSSSSASVTTETESSTQTESSTATASSTSTRSTLTRSTTSSSATSSPSSVPAGGMASGLTSNLALVFLAAGALFMIN